MMRKVYLDGEMAEKFGSEFTIYAERMSDVFRCLECNFPELRQYLMDCHEKDIGFLCQVGGTGLDDEEELLLSLQEGDVYISPQPAGSKSGFGKILAAIAIVALVVWTGGQALALANASAALAGGTTTAFSIGAAISATGTIGLMAMSVAVNLALTGIQQMMAPDPSVDSPDTPIAENSYLFSGAEQNILEGDPVPVVYGQLRIPGRPIGFEIRNKENVFANYSYGGGVQGGGTFGNGGPGSIQTEIK